MGIYEAEPGRVFSSFHYYFCNSVTCSGRCWNAEVAGGVKLSFRVMPDAATPFYYFQLVSLKSSGQTSDKTHVTNTFFNRETYGHTLNTLPSIQYIRIA